MSRGLAKGGGGKAPWGGFIWHTPLTCNPSAGVQAGWRGWLQEHIPFSRAPYWRSLRGKMELQKQSKNEHSNTSNTHPQIGPPQNRSCFTRYSRIVRYILINCTIWQTIRDYKKNYCKVNLYNSSVNLGGFKQNVFTIIIQHSNKKGHPTQSAQESLLQAIFPMLPQFLTVCLVLF